MSLWLRRSRTAVWLLSVFVLMLAASSVAADSSRETDDPAEAYTRVDSEIQAIKQQMLELNQEILMLEELVQYPLDRQFVVFMSLQAGSGISLRQVSLEIDSRQTGSHTYTASEHAALEKGGAHRFYAGQMEQGEHALRISVRGSDAQGRPFHSQHSAMIIKGHGRKIMEIGVAENNGESPQPELLVNEW